METGVDSTEEHVAIERRRKSLGGPVVRGARRSGWAVRLPDATLPPKPIPEPRASEPAEPLEPDDVLVPFPSGAPTEEIPLWLPPDHHARPASARRRLAAARARARTALGTATVVGTDLAATPPGPEHDLIEPTAEDLLRDTAPGLSKFNIGTVPAPITPPPSSRRAAWFSSVSAGLVLASLVTVASVVQSNRQVEHRDALPDFPNVQLPTTTTGGPATTGRQTPASSRRAQPGSTSAPGESAAPSATASGTTATALLPGGVSVLTEAATATIGGATSPLTTAAGTNTVPTTSSPAATTSPPSTVTRFGLLLLRSTNTDALAPTTQRFFELASGDLRAAFDQYASPRLKNRGFAAFAQDFAGVSRLQATTIVVQPDTGSTITTLTATLADGTSTTQHRELVFSAGDTPLIDDEQQV